MKKQLVALATTSTLVAGAAAAHTVDFTVDSASVHVTDQGCFGSCTISEELNPSLVTTAFTLTEGGPAQELHFFDLTVSGIGLGVYSIEASLDFLPPGGGISTGGEGGFGTFFGKVSGGTLSWDDPIETVFFGPGDTGVYMIELEQGVAIGTGNSESVSAYVSLQAAPVPLPASVLFLLAGVGGLGAMKLRKRAA
jgi:hypothetical protein